MANVPRRDLLWRDCFRRTLWPCQVMGDTTSDATGNIVALEDAGIRAFFPLPDFERRTPFYRMSRFTDDAQRDESRCPRGQPFRRRKTKYPEDTALYRANAAFGTMCPVTAEGTASNHGRMVHRSFSEACLNTVRGHHPTEPDQQAMRQRNVRVALLAEAREGHGLRRLRLRRLRVRGLLNATIQGLLIAARQNLKRFLNRFLAATRWGRRHAPCGSPLAILGHPWGVKVALARLGVIADRAGKPAQVNWGRSGL